MTTVLLVIGCLIVAGFYSGTETGSYRLNRIRMRHRAEGGSRLAGILQHVVADMERFVCTSLVVQNAAVYGSSILTTALLARHFDNEFTCEFASTVILAPSLLVFAEILPKSTFQVMADPLMPWCAPWLWITDKLLMPVTRPLLKVIAVWRRLLGGSVAAPQPAMTVQHLSFLLAEGTKEGAITSQQSLMVQNIMSLGKRPLREVMVPLQKVRMISASASNDEARRVIASSDQARLPVYADETSHVVGILRTLDYLCEKTGADVRALMIQPVFLKADMQLDEAFRLLQEKSQAMGVVVDSSNRALGIVTIADILQEIFRTITPD